MCKRISHHCSKMTQPQMRKIIATVNRLVCSCLGSFLLFFWIGYKNNWRQHTNSSLNLFILRGEKKNAKIIPHASAYPSLKLFSKYKRLTKKWIFKKKLTLKQLHAKNFHWRILERVINKGGINLEQQRKPKNVNKTVFITRFYYKQSYRWYS